jgi:hypothetical protein
MDDIAAGRIAYVYRPDHNVIFKVTKKANAVDQIELEHIANQTGLAFSPPDLTTTASKLETVIGLPAGLVSTRVA